MENTLPAQQAVATDATSFLQPRSMEKIVPPDHYISVFRRRPLMERNPPEPQATQPIVFYVYEDWGDAAFIYQLSGHTAGLYSLDIQPLYNRDLDIQRKALSHLVIKVPQAKKTQVYEAIRLAPIMTNLMNYNCFNWAIRVMRDLVKKLYGFDDMTDEDRQKLKDMLQTKVVDYDDVTWAEKLLMLNARDEYRLKNKFISVFRRLHDPSKLPSEPQARQPVVLLVYEDLDDQGTIIQLYGSRVPGYVLDIRPLTMRQDDAEKKRLSLLVVRVPHEKKRELFETIQSVPIRNDISVFDAYNWVVRVERALLNKFYGGTDMSSEGEEGLTRFLDERPLQIDEYTMLKIERKMWQR